MRTYKEFISILENVSGGSLMFTKRFGSSGLPGSTAVTGNVQGGSARGTQFSASGTYGRGTVSGQGDRINQGIDAALRNYQSGTNANTSTSTVRTGGFGSLNANVSGGTSRPSPTPVRPVAKPVAKPTQKPVVVSGQQRPSTSVTSSQQRPPTPTPAAISQQQQRPSTQAGSPPAPAETAVEREARWAAASRARDELGSMAAIDRARMAKGEKPISNVTTLYPGLGR